MFDLPNWLLIFPVLASLIFVHELGHFVTAKLFHIKVTEFGFGFPPRIYGIPFRGTIYSINLIPMGGFVRMVGEEDPTDPESFASQKIYKRLLVLAAGSFMNVVLPIVIFTVLFMLPHDALVGGSVLVTGVAPGSPAEIAGLRSGDMIMSVDGEPVISPSELIDVVKNKSGQPIELSLRRASRVTGLGTSPEFATFDTVLVEPRAHPPSLKIVEEVTDPTAQVSLTEARKYNRELDIGDTMTQGAIGVMIGLVNPKYEEITEPIWKAVPQSIETVWSVLTFTWKGISEGISSRSNPGISGPVGIAKATGEVVEQLGVWWVFQLAAILSISLAIINMLPFPALDGGRFTFVLIEWVRRGKRISPKKEGLVHLVGFVVLIGLIVVVTYFDIIKVMSGESFLR